MREQLWTAFENLSENDDVRAVILTGAGDAFCAGIDVKEMGDAGVAWSMAKIRRLHRIAREIAGLKKPKVAAVNGVCVGVGGRCALASDIGLASDPAQFSQLLDQKSLGQEQRVSATVAIATSD